MTAGRVEPVGLRRPPGASIVDACCDFLEELLGAHRGEFLASVELGVAAGRQPELLSVGSLSASGAIP